MNNFKIETATKSHVEEAAKIFFESFNTFNQSVGLPPEWPSIEFCNQVVDNIVHHSGYYSVVALNPESKIIGSNFLECHDEVAAPGPISVALKTQDKGIGKALMEEVMIHSDRLGKKSIRLVQVANNNKSFSLYANLGFETKEILTYVRGRLTTEHMNDCVVRKITDQDFGKCDSLYMEANGFSRINDIRQNIDCHVVEKGNRIVGYHTAPSLLGHGIFKSEEAFISLVGHLSRAQGDELNFHIPARLYPEILSFLLTNGFKTIRQEILMAKGTYNYPSSSFIYLPGMAY